MTRARDLLTRRGTATDPTGWTRNPEEAAISGRVQKVTKTKYEYPALNFGVNGVTIA